MNPSSKLLGLVNDWADAYIKSVDLPVKILEQGEKEGLTKEELRDLIVKSLKSRGLAERRIRQIMPEGLRFSNRTTIKSKVRNSNAALIAASEADTDFELPSNLPVTSPETIIMKSEGELAEAEYLQEQKATPPVRLDIPQLLASKMLTEDEIFSWLKSRADGLNIIYHETIGIEKFKRDYYSSSLNRGFNNYHNIFFELSR